jgi:hypothetical protein
LEFVSSGERHNQRKKSGLFPYTRNKQANEQTALMTQLRFVDKSDSIPVDTFERAPKRGHSTKKMQPFNQDPDFVSPDEAPTTTDDEQ